MAKSNSSMITKFSNRKFEFRKNHLVVITSSVSIKIKECKRYLLDNWKEIMVDNTGLLILGGIHGKRRGSPGRFDQTVEKNIEYHIEDIKRKKKRDMKERHIEVFYECVQEHLDKDTRRPNPDELVRAITDYQLTVLMLAFCYSSQSILKYCLRSQGIYSLLIMQKERGKITEGRCIFLDDQQKAALDKMRAQKPKLTLIQGPFGTGKTILLMEALRIKMAQTQGEIRVIVTSDTKQKALIEYIRTNLELNNLKGKLKGLEVEFSDCLKDVAVQDNLGIFGQVNTIAELNKCIKRLANSANNAPLPSPCKRMKYSTLPGNVKTILVIDEFFIKGKQDWNKFKIHPDVDVIIAFHPRKESNLEFKLPHASTADVFCCKLETVYRNSYKVLRLCSFISSHASLFAETSTAKIYPILSPENIEKKKGRLPPGETPVWIELETDDYILSAYSNI